MFRVSNEDEKDKESISGVAVSTAGQKFNITITETPNGWLIMPEKPQDKADMIKTFRVKKAYPTKTCPVCGKEFAPSRADQVYCNAKCSSVRRVRSYRERQKQ